MCMAVRKGVATIWATEQTKYAGEQSVGLVKNEEERISVDSNRMVSLTNGLKTETEVGSRRLLKQNSDFHLKMDTFQESEMNL